MKTDKFAKMSIGEEYDQGEYAKAVADDLQTIKYVLKALIDKVQMLEIMSKESFEERMFLRSKLEE